MTTIMYSQDFKQWAFDVEGGLHSINDESAVNTNSKYYLGAGIRYNFNPTFGLGVRAGYNDLNLRSLEGVYVDSKYLRFNLDATVNLFRILDLYSPNVAILAHGGPGIGLISDNYDETVLNLQGGITALVKLSRSVALKADYSIVGNISQDLTLDGQYTNNNYGVTSTIHTVSGGLVFYLGNKKTKGKEHADWYVAPPIKTTIEVRPEQKIIRETKIIREEAICDCEKDTQSEYVFFDHDKFNIKDTELNAIYKAYAQLAANPSYQLIIKGFASPTKSSTYYNLVLSENRSEALRKKFELLGLDASRVSVESYGKDVDRSAEFVHDAARRVELIIVKQ
jgi:outer membrane protein OmpA-like peptidoglycan-associated protein